MTPRQLYNHTLLRGVRQSADMKMMASAMRMSTASNEDFKRWLKRG